MSKANYICNILKGTILLKLTVTVRDKKKKLYGPFLWMGFNSLKARATLRRQFTLYHYLATFVNLKI